MRKKGGGGLTSVLYLLSPTPSLFPYLRRLYVENKFSREFLPHGNHGNATTSCKSTWDTVPYFGINGLSMILCLWSPLHPLSKLLAIQDHTQNLEEQLWMGGRREVSIIFYRLVTRSDLKQERSFFRRSVSSFLQLVVAFPSILAILQSAGAQLSYTPPWLSFEVLSLEEDFNPKIWSTFFFYEENVPFGCVMHFAFRFFIQLSSRTAHMSCDFPLLITGSYINIRWFCNT